MDPMTMAALGSAGLNLAGSLIGGNKAAQAAKDAAKQQKEMYERNMAILESIGIPSEEAQRIALQNPEYVGDLVNETLGASGMENISTDPNLRQNQMDVLAQLKQLSQEGMGIEDRIAFDQMMGENAAQQQSRQRAIESDMAQRGMLDSGVAAAMQMQAQQQANQDALKRTQALAQQSQQGRMQALSQLANQSGQLENLDWNRQSDVARAGDAVQQFNANVRNQANQFNLQNKQNIANQVANTANQQEIYNKGLAQQKFQNQMTKAGMQTGQNTNFGNQQAQNTLTAGQGQAQMYSGIGAGLGNIVTGIGQNKNK